MTWDDDDVAPLRDDATSRLINLVLLLESSRRGFTRAEIMQRIAGYEGNEAATARKFERDKELLLAAGILLEGYSPDPTNPAEFRYQINPDRAQLPSVSFSAGERSALQAALAAWRRSGNREDARQARLKLEALGVELRDITPVIELRTSTDVDELLRAMSVGKVVKFRYRKPNQAEPEERRLQVWGVSCRSGDYFFYGFDEDRAEPRVFNLARVIGKFTAIGKEAAYQRPSQTQLADVMSDTDESQPVMVRVRIASERGWSWRKRIGTELALSMAEGEFDLPITSLQLTLPRLAADAPDVVVLEPAEIRNRVAALLGVPDGAV